MDVSHWFSNSLSIHYPSQSISAYDYLADDSNIKKIEKMFSAFGTGIVGIEFVQTEQSEMQSKLPESVWNQVLRFIKQARAELNKKPSAKSAPRMVGAEMMVRSDRDFFIIKVLPDSIQCKIIEFRHEGDGLFRLGEESDGTKRLLDLLEILLVRDGKTYVIDELDRCLHPCLTYEFVKAFFEMTKKRRVQLIVTTHESRLLDFDLLRRDEVWFVNKRKPGVSDLYSLEEYNTRFDHVIDKAYLEGRYGGVPVFTALFPLEEEPT